MTNPTAAANVERNDRAATRAPLARDTRYWSDLRLTPVERRPA